MSYVLLVTSKTLGKTDPILGEKLMFSYFYSLSEGDLFPSHILLLNEGVKLATEDTPFIPLFKHLIEKGVEVYACGLCLDYYQTKDELKVGEVGNMYLNQEIMANAGNVISLG